jgi:predicted RNase H-like HicB family nuclease
MEPIANMYLEQLPKEVYLATSDDIPGLVAQGRTVTALYEIQKRLQHSPIH